MSASKSLAIVVGAITAAFVIGTTSPVPPPSPVTNKGGFEWGISAPSTSVVDQTPRTS